MVRLEFTPPTRSPKPTMTLITILSYQFFSLCEQTIIWGKNTI